MITVLHLYRRELNINGDTGNVLALRKRAEWRGAEVRVVEYAPGDPLPADVHLVHIGSGSTSSQAGVRDDVLRIAPTLRGWASEGVPFLAIAAGWQLLGRELDGAPAGGVFPSTARLDAPRRIGEVAGDSELGEVAGFVNFGATMTLEGGEPLVRLADGSVDGVRAGDLIGTHLHGSFLPMNPAWADLLLGLAAARAGVTLGAPDARTAEADDYAARSRAAIRARLR